MIEIDIVVKNGKPSQRKVLPQKIRSSLLHSDIALSPALAICEKLGFFHELRTESQIPHERTPKRMEVEQKIHTHLNTSEETFW